MLTTELIEHILATIPGRTVGVLGDLFLDRYLDIDPALNEPSVETGLTAYQVTRVRSYPGAAGTVINNLAALGVGHICPIGYVGDDGEGYELQQALKKLSAVNLAGVFTVPLRRTPTYTKPMLGDKELNRLDIKNRTPTPDEVQTIIIDLLDTAWPTFDALLVLDQVSKADCGVVTKRVRDRLAQRADRDPGKFVLADSRERIGEFRNVCVKPNRAELKSIVPPDPSLTTANDPHGKLRHARRVSGYQRIGRHIFLTCGEEGILLIGPDGHDQAMIFANPVAGPIDIVGAGDSCSAGIASAMVSGLTHEQAAAFGNLVASITIQQIGVTGTASPEQVRTRWREVQST